MHHKLCHCQYCHPGTFNLLALFVKCDHNIIYMVSDTLTTSMRHYVMRCRCIQLSKPFYSMPGQAFTLDGSAVYSMMLHWVFGLHKILDNRQRIFRKEVKNNYLIRGDLDTTGGSVAISFNSYLYTAKFPRVVSVVSS